MTTKNQRSKWRKVIFHFCCLLNTVSVLLWLEIGLPCRLVWTTRSGEKRMVNYMILLNTRQHCLFCLNNRICRLTFGRSPANYVLVSRFIAFCYPYLFWLITVIAVFTLDNRTVRLRSSHYSLACLQNLFHRSRPIFEKPTSAYGKIALLLKECAFRI